MFCTPGSSQNASLLTAYSCTLTVYCFVTVSGIQDGLCLSKEASQHLTT